jgi:hypothetical protein
MSAQSQSSCVIREIGIHPTNLAIRSVRSELGILRTGGACVCPVNALAARIASDFSTQKCSRSRVWSSEIQQCGRVILVPSIYFLGGLARRGRDDRFVAMTEP